MKIKTKKEMTLPELIEWITENNITYGQYMPNLAENTRFIAVNGYGEMRIYGFIRPDEIFSVEIEEPITEDTVIPKLMVKFKSPSRYQVFSNDYINGFEVEEGNIEAFYIMNEDLTMTLIWTKEKGLIE